MRQTTLSLATLPLLAVLLAASPAEASTPIDQRHPLAADGELAVVNAAGRVEVVAWDRPEVAIEGSLGDGVERLLVEGDGRRLRVEVVNPSGGGWFGGGGSSGPSELRLRVPAGASLSLQGVSADLASEGARGERLALASVSGALAAVDARVDILGAETVSGGARLEVEARRAEVASVSGALSLRGRIVEHASIETVSGALDATLADVRRLETSSVSGATTLALSLAEGAEVSAETLSGRLQLRLPAEASARIEAESFSGRIEAGIPGRLEEGRGPGRRFDAILGGGDARVSLETFSGPLRIALDEVITP